VQERKNVHVSLREILGPASYACPGGRLLVCACICVPKPRPVRVCACVRLEVKVRCKGGVRVKINERARLGLASRWCLARVQ
jgi:hypothetical protein